MDIKKSQPKESVPETEYDSNWILETWGWDTPEIFIRSQGRNIRPRINRALEIAKLKPGMHILDIGCGRGEVVLHCGRNGIDAIGADYSPQAIEIAMQTRETHTEEEQARMRFICGDVKELQVERKFDRIFMLDLVEHLHDWELADVFTTCERVLAPDGAIIIHTLPNRWLYEITYRWLLRIVMPRLPADPRSQKEKAIHINEMSIIHLAELLRQSGYESRVWLQDVMVEQAHWHLKEPLSGKRGRLYQWLAHPVSGIMFKALAKTPLRLLIVNDIFAIGWRKGRIAPLKLPASWIERLIFACLKK
jgi:2-polyprenyl-3-methyl-5-hydroxy-6-metoxy-1,4-benzoquinol methylase